MSIWQFLHEHILIALVALYLTYLLLVRLLRLPALIVRGWPPSDETHVCDADGDWHSKKEEQ